MTRVGKHDLGGRHIFLTGGTGSVGRTLLDYLARCHERHGGLRVAVLTRDPAGFVARHPVQARHSWITLVPGELAALPQLPPDTTDVIHAAADTHMDAGHAAWIAQIVGGTGALLARSADAVVKRFLLLSSGAIYGPQPASLLRLNEEHPGAPDPLLATSAYGQAKRVAEQLCTTFHRELGLATVIARLFAFGGRHLPAGCVPTSVVTTWRMRW